MTNQPPDATTPKSASRSKRKARRTVFFSLLPAMITAGLVLFIGIATAPPRYVARASFVVDWNILAPAPDAGGGETLRSDPRSTLSAEVASLPDSEQGLSDVLDRAGDFGGLRADKAAVLAKLHKRLRVNQASQTGHNDLFTIEMRDNDPVAAQMAANWVLRGTVSKLKAAAKTGNGLMALRTPAEAGSDSLANLGEVLFADPVKLIKYAQVETCRGGYGFRVLLAALILGGLAAGYRWMERQVELVVTALRVTAMNASRRPAVSEAALARQPVLVPRRPILIRPLPRFDATDDLPGAGGLRHQGEVR